MASSAYSLTPNVLGHWSTLVENFQASPQQFYDSLKTALARRQMPDVAGSTTVEHREGGLGSTKRQYVRIARRELRVDVCGAPFGTGFFFSWWTVGPGGLRGVIYLAVLFAALVFGGWAVIHKFHALLGIPMIIVGLPLVLLALGALVRWRILGPEHAVLAMPFLGPLYGRIFLPETYFNLDTASMFQTAVHAAVLEVVDAMTKERGLRALSDEQRKPQMREFHGRELIGSGAA